MIILPAIDLKDGRCVRLLRGDFATVHKVAEDPIAVANLFRENGAKQIHVVDLDGAKDGVRKNAEIVAQLAKVPGLLIELGGGIRNMEDLRTVFELGVHRAVIGSAAVTDPDFVRAAAEQYGSRIAVGVDALDGRVKTAGWVEDSGKTYLQFAAEMEQLSVKHLIFTDIATDGALSGPPMERLKALRESVSCRITASGGISCNGDIPVLKEAGMDAAIIGKAFYAGKIDLAQAIREAGEQCWQNG